VGAVCKSATGCPIIGGSVTVVTLGLGEIGEVIPWWLELTWNFKPQAFCHIG
jgi:hypothetical protein